MDKEMDRSGWIKCGVLVTRHRYLTVITKAGVFTIDIIVITAKTCLYRATHLYTTVSLGRRLQDVDKLEGVQKKATKIIIRGKKLTYENRLRKLKLSTLTYRQVRGDMIDVYKFLSGKYDKNCSVKLQLYSCRGSASGVETRDNLYKSVPNRSTYELRRHYLQPKKSV